MSDQPQQQYPPHSNSQQVSASSMSEHPPDQTKSRNPPLQREALEESKERDKESQQQNITDQSNDNVSIGNRTAEELVGDILASDPLDDDLDLMLSNSIANDLKVGANPTSVSNYVKNVTDSGDSNQNLDGILMLRHDTNEVHKGNPAQIYIPVQHQQHVNEVLSPSRILASSCNEEDDDFPAAGSENPFEVVMNENEQQEDQEEFFEISDNEEDEFNKASQENTLNEGDLQENSVQLKVKVEEIKDNGALDDQLSVSKQRSNSVPESSPEKKVKKRLTLPKISLFQKTTVPSQQQIQTEKLSDLELSSPEKKEQQSTEITNKAKKEGLMSKLFSKKKDKFPKEENKSLQKVVAPDSTKSTSKPGFQSRLAKFLGVKSKSKEQQKLEYRQPESSPVEEEKEVAVEVTENVAAPEHQSSLDQGFRSTIDDQYEVDIAQHDEEDATDGDYDSEDTNDEIYSAHEGVDFRPTEEAQFAFAGQQSQVTSPSLPIGRRSYPTSDSNDSRQANYGESSPSVGSFEDQNSNYEPQQRSHSQMDEDQMRNQHTNIVDGEELEFQFPGAQQQPLRNQSPFERSPQDDPESFQDNMMMANTKNQPYRHSAGFMVTPMVGFEALSSGGARTTAAGSQPYGNAGAGGSDRLPFSVNMGSDEQQQLLYMNPEARQSVIVPTSSTAMGHNQNVDREKRSPRSLSNCFQSGRGMIQDVNNQESFLHGRFSDNADNVPLMRISEPFTPTQAPSFITHHKPCLSLGAIQNQQPYNHVVQPEFQPTNQMDMQAENQITRYSETNLGNDQLQTLNLAYKLFNNRPSAPHRNNLQRQDQNQGRPVSGSNSSTGALSSNHTNSSLNSHNNKLSRARPKRNSNASNTNASNTATSGQSSVIGQSQKKKTRRGNPKGPAIPVAPSDKRQKGQRQSTTKQTESESSSQAQFEKQQQIQMKQKEQQDAANAAAALKVQTASVSCICCSRGTQCLLEQQIDKFADLPSDEKVRGLILIDQQLQHFMPMDTKQKGNQVVGPSSVVQNSVNARAGIEGRLKDDIWHECCQCCSQIRKTLLQEMFGNVSELCRDQLCSKFIQVQLSRCQSTELAIIDAFYEEICNDEEQLFQEEATPQSSQEETKTAVMDQEGNPASLMKNVFGNYVIQLIFEKGSTERVEKFYQIMLKQIEKLSFDQFGCRIIQKALVWLPLQKKQEIITKFNKKLLIEMMFSEEGNYIVQCIILNLPASEIQFIIPLVENQVLLLCKDKRGCRVIQRMLEKFPRSDIEIPVIQKIIAAANDLTPQQYGNYVITHILQNGLEIEKIQIIDAIIDNIVKFSLYQLGSNVVENCLKGAPASHRDIILEKILDIPVAQTQQNQNQVTLANLLENQFGNYVIQHAFNLAKPQRKRILFTKIEQCANEGHVDRTNTYAKHVYSLIHAHFNALSNLKTQQSIVVEEAKIGKQANRNNRQNHNYAGSEREQQIKAAIEATTGINRKSNLSVVSAATTNQQPEESLQQACPQSRRKTTSSVDRLEEENDEEEGSDADPEGDDGTGVAKVKKRRRRKRRRGNAKKRNQMLCQEDILQELSDSSREEFLQQQPSPLLHVRSVSQSVFVSDSYAQTCLQAREKIIQHSIPNQTAHENEEQVKDQTK